MNFVPSVGVAGWLAATNTAGTSIAVNQRGWYI